MNWRRLNNLLHRDIGYVAVGLTLAYAISGLAVNHKADWNPNYRIEKTAGQIEPIGARDRETVTAEALRKLQLTEPLLAADRGAVGGRVPVTVERDSASLDLTIERSELLRGSAAGR